MDNLQQNLSKRERQIMDIIFRREKATAQEVLDDLPDPPSYSAVRALLKILEDKGHLTHKKIGLKYLFVPTVHPEEARDSAVKQIIKTYFNNSIEDAVCAIIGVEGKNLSEADYQRMIDRINQEKQKEEK